MQWRHTNGYQLHKESESLLLSIPLGISLYGDFTTEANFGTDLLDTALHLNN